MPTEKAVGRPREIPLDDPERRVGAVVVEAEGGLAVDVRAAEAERVRLEQRWRTFERGRFEPEDAHA